MRADVSTLMIRVNGQVEPHELDKVRVLGKSKLVGQIVAIVFVFVDGRDFAVMEDVAVDSCGDCWQLGDNIHRVLVRVLPVLRLGHAFGICLGK